MIQSDTNMLAVKYKIYRKEQLKVQLFNYITRYLDLTIFVIASISFTIASSKIQIKDVKDVQPILLYVLSTLVALLVSMTITRIQFDKAVDKIHRVDMLDEQNDIYDHELRKYIEEHEVKEAVLI